MSSHRAIRSILVGLVFGAMLAPAHADSDAPCSAQLRDKLKIANTSPDICETTSRLVPGRAVVLALWSTEPDSPPEIPLAAVLDRKSLEAGRKDFLYRRKAMGESLQPFLFDGKTVSVAIADFDGTGRTGWGMWIVPDADYSFDVTVYDPKAKKFIEPGDAANQMIFVATDLDAKVQISPGQILVPFCDSASGTPTHPTYQLQFETYRLKNGAYASGGRIPASAASPAERDKCKQTAR
jgi:hypothetical protein